MAIMILTQPKFAHASTHVKSMQICDPSLPVCFMRDKESDKERVMRYVCF